MIHVALALTAAVLLAPCPGRWMPLHQGPAPDGVVLAMTVWDRDGPGPSEPLLVVAGSFYKIGGSAAHRIATLNPATGQWSPLGDGTNHPVMALAVLPNGDLVAGGNFTVAGGVAANLVARWDGENWFPLGTGVSADLAPLLLPSVETLAVLPNGDLVAGGRFTTAGGVLASRIARWDGVSWSPFGPGLNDTVDALTLLPNGDLIAGGIFTASGTTNVRGLAKWDGATWSAIGGFEGFVYCMATTPGGDLIVGGNFYSVGDVPARSIARWNGLQWSALGTTVYRAFSTVLALPDGDIVATGGFVSSGPLGANFIARWDGTAWHPYGGGVNQAPGALALLPGGDLAVGGGFTVYDDLSIRYLARWSTRPACPGDFDCSGGRPDYHDILEFLDAWFAREPRADINASGAFTVQDVLDFLAAFFATCD